MSRILGGWSASPKNTGESGQLDGGSPRLDGGSCLPIGDTSTVMSKNEAPDLVIARFQDYFGRRSVWQRRLWVPGTITLLQESSEAAQLFELGFLREGVVGQLARSAEIQAGPDHGLGSKGVRDSIRRALERLTKDPTASRYQLDILLEDAGPSYLSNWREEFVKSPAAMATEKVSRLVAGHLLVWVSALRSCTDGARGSKREGSQPRSPRSSTRLTRSLAVLSETGLFSSRYLRSAACSNVCLRSG